MEWSRCSAGWPVTPITSGRGKIFPLAFIVLSVSLESNLSYFCLEGLRFPYLHLIICSALLVARAPATRSIMPLTEVLPLEIILEAVTTDVVDYIRFVLQLLRGETGAIFVGHLPKCLVILFYASFTASRTGGGRHLFARATRAGTEPPPLHYTCKSKLSPGGICLMILVSHKRDRTH